MINQYEKEKKELQKLNEKQKKLVEDKLIQEKYEAEKLNRRKISLIGVLQKKARESLLWELEKAKQMMV